MGGENFDSYVEKVCEPEHQPIDEKLKLMKRAEVLTLGEDLRLRWFYLLQVKHRELLRVFDDLSELLEPLNEVRIISLIGMTGIGKSTLADNLIFKLVTRFSDAAHAHEIPVIYVKAPANGDRSISWTALFESILKGGGEVLVDKKRSVQYGPDGEFQQIKRKGSRLYALRESMDEMFRQRNVRMLVIDEVFHLLRFENYSATMDTLKSLVDSPVIKSPATKLLLIGNFDIVELVTQYAQTTRRNEIIHYQRYKYEGNNKKQLIADQKEFKRVVGILQENWPSALVPNLSAIWHELMHASLGSVGMLKILLIRLAALQMRSRDKNITVAMLRKAGKSPKALQKIDQETVSGEERIEGFCYGDSLFTEENFKAMCG